MKQGYLGIFRKFFNEHEFWKEKRKYSKAEAWIDLMQSARYGEEPETLFDKRGSYVLEYGDVYISLRYLGERWQWSKNKVQGFLAYLEKRESILFKKRDSHRTIIHIANLKGYTEWIKGERDSEGTVKGQSRDSEGTKKKKVNKEKKEKNKTFTLDSIEYQLAELLHTEILKINSEHKANLQTWSKDVDRMIRLDNRQPNKIKQVILWCQQDPFWQGNILSTKKLRDKYDQLLMKMNSRGKGGYQTRSERNAQAKEDFLKQTITEVDITPKEGE